MAQNGKLTPNLDQNTTKMLNLTVLQRMDPFVEEILFTAAHVTLYDFNIDSSQWSRKDVEGPLFVVKRGKQPRFQFIVMNRRSTENLVENLLEDFEFELQCPYLLYRNAAQDVNGIWFYNQRECEDVANLFNRILSAYSKVSPQAKVSSRKSDLEENEAVSIIKGPSHPSSSSFPDSSSFLNFFSAATDIQNNASHTPNLRQAYQSAPTASIPSHAPGIISSAALAQQASSVSFLTSTTPSLAHETSQINNINKPVTNLLKPSSFATSSSSLMMPPTSVSMPSALHPNLQRPYGTPMLQPFPPPDPSPSLTPSSISNPNVPPINRDKVHGALMSLVQDNQFIDMVYQALLKVQHS